MRIHFPGRHVVISLNNLKICLAFHVSPNCETFAKGTRYQQLFGSTGRLAQTGSPFSMARLASISSGGIRGKSSLYFWYNTFRMPRSIVEILKRKRAVSFFRNQLLSSFVRQNPSLSSQCERISFRRSIPVLSDFWSSNNFVASLIRTQVTRVFSTWSPSSRAIASTCWRTFWRSRQTFSISSNSIDSQSIPLGGRSYMVIGRWNSSSRCPISLVLPYNVIKKQYSVLVLTTKVLTCRRARKNSLFSLRFYS